MNLPDNADDYQRHLVELRARLSLRKFEPCACHQQEKWPLISRDAGRGLLRFLIREHP
ncbi:hypothetical protein [Microbispora bryophytorum]|uniref:hypothetical protein n=1 Tax=Microbispora bryophytorum TaxID=1460882 RepID=UPI00371E29E9